MNIILRLAWRNLWRHPRRTWLTTGAMVFSNVLLVFMISLQFGMYGLMIDNTLQSFTGHMQVQAPGYIDDSKMRQVVPDAIPLATSIRQEIGQKMAAARGAAFALASSEDRSYSRPGAGVRRTVATGSARRRAGARVTAGHPGRRRAEPRRRVGVASGRPRPRARDG